MSRPISGTCLQTRSDARTTTNSSTTTSARRKQHELLDQPSPTSNRGRSGSGRSTGAPPLRAGPSRRGSPGRFGRSSRRPTHHVKTGRRGDGHRRRGGDRARSVARDASDRWSRCATGRSGSACRSSASTRRVGEQPLRVVLREPAPRGSVWYPHPSTYTRVFRWRPGRDGQCGSCRPWSVIWLHLVTFGDGPSAKKFVADLLTSVVAPPARLPKTRFMTATAASPARRGRCR
jgi:hypothetical protein